MIKNRRLYKTPVFETLNGCLPSPDNQLSPLRFRGFNIRQDAIQLIFTAYRAYSHTLAVPSTKHQRLCALHDSFDQRISNIVFDNQSTGSRTPLAGAGKRPNHCRLSRCIQISVGQDNQRVFPSHFKLGTSKGVGRQNRYLAPYLS